jgi:hypothetical protein
MDAVCHKAGPTMPDLLPKTNFPSLASTHHLLLLATDASSPAIAKTLLQAQGGNQREHKLSKRSLVQPP